MCKEMLRIGTCAGQRLAHSIDERRSMENAGWEQLTVERIAKT
jgi:hypothetical protein